MKQGLTPRAPKLLLTFLAIAALSSNAAFAGLMIPVVPEDSGDTIKPIGPISDGGGVTPALSGSTDYSWNQNAAASWSLNTNWTPTAPVGGPDAAGLFVVVNADITANRTISLFNTGDAGDAIKTIGRLDIGDPNGSHNYTIAAGTGNGVLNFDGNGANAQLNQLSTSNNTTISAPITLNTSLDITNASSNNLTLSGGISSATAGAKTLTTSTGLVTISTAITNGSGTIAITQNGPGTLALGSVANTYSGDTTINGGTITIGGSGTPLGSGTNLNMAGGTLTTTADRSVSTAALAQNIVLSADSTISTTSTTANVNLNFTGTVTGSAGTLTLKNSSTSATNTFDPRFSGGDFTMTRPIILMGNGLGGTTRLTDANASGTTHTYSGVISGDGSFRRLTGSTGATVFLADNTYTGSTTINSGTLQLGNGGTAGSLSPSSTISIGSGAVLRFDHTSGADFVQGTNFSSSAITGAGSIIKEGTASLTFNTANTFSGGLTINKGTVVATADGALGTGGINLNAGNVTLTLQGGTNPDFINNAATLTVGFNTDVVNLNYSGTEVVGGLIVEGNAVAPGVYGSGDFAEFIGTGTITVVPEPTTVAMMVLGAGLLAGAQRFRRKLR